MNFPSDDDVATFRNSGQFDEAWYVDQYPDVKMVGIDPAKHFLWLGIRLGRKPRRDHDVRTWPEVSPERLLRAATAPAIPSERQTPAETPLVRKPRRKAFNAMVQRLEASKLFDSEYYFDTYPEARQSGLSAAEHYLTSGADLGYDPSPRFSTDLYWQQYPDTARDNPLVHYLQFGQNEGRRYFRVRQHGTTQHSEDPLYDQWIADVELPMLSPSHIEKLRQTLGTQIYQPKIAVLMPVYNTPDDYLRKAIDSVLRQIYENWELCIADDCSTQPHVRTTLEEYARKDSRVKVVFRSENGHIAHATNSAMELVDAPWVALLDHDDALRPHTLAEIVLEINRHPSAQIIYTDEDKVDANGLRYDPFFKPDFSLELVRSQNYLNHLTVHRTQNIRSVGGWDPDTIGSQDYDINLRVIERVGETQIRHIPKVLYHWRAIEGSTALAMGEKPVCFVNAVEALKRHVERQKLPAEVIPLDDIGYTRFRFSVPDPAPLVTLIVPTRDKLELLEACLESVFAKTTYDNYELLVLNNESVEKATLQYFDKLRTRDNVRIIPIDGPYNYSLFHNRAVPQARGSIIGLINNDVEVISPDWLTEMVSWAAQPTIGCVGAKLYYGDDTIQHAGVIVGMGGVAGHGHKFRPRTHNGYFGNLRLVQNMSAVTAACMLFRKHIYDEVGGMDEVHLPVSFNDVDFCLKVREAGYKCVWTPFAELYHHESKTRGYEDTPEKQARASREVAAIKERWGEKIQRDPFYSTNLSLWDERSSYTIDV
jgi:GT2 family glycosyltransferase